MLTRSRRADHRIRRHRPVGPLPVYVGDDALAILSAEGIGTLRVKCGCNVSRARGMFIFLLVDKKLAADLIKMNTLLSGDLFSLRIHTLLLLMTDESA